MILLCIIQSLLTFTYMTQWYQRYVLLLLWVRYQRLSDEMNERCDQKVLRFGLNRFCLLAAVLCPTRHLPSPGKLVSGRNVIPHLSHLLGLLVAVAFFSLEGKVSTALRFKKPVLIMGGESGSHGFVHKAKRNVVKPCNNEVRSVFIRTQCFVLSFFPSLCSI